MAEETNEKAEETKGEEQAKTPGAGGEAKYTDKQVDEIVAKKFAAWKKQTANEVAEAQKLAQMNAAEKADYELKKATDRIAELEREKAVREMAAEVRGHLKEGGIDAPDALVSLLVGKDADATKRACDEFAGLFNEAVEAAVKKRLAGSAPGAGGTAKVTKASILSIKDREERQKAIEDNINLFL